MIRLLPWYAAGFLFLGLHLLAVWFGSALWGGVAGTCLLAVVLLICTGTGRLLLKVFRLTALSESEGTLIGATLGLGVLALAVFGLGLIGLLKTWSVAALLALLWILGATEMRDILTSLGANRNLLVERPVWSGSLAALLGLVLWTAWMPPHQYDALVYHLPLPAAYLRTGGIAPVDHLLYSHFPQNGEMLFALALALGSDVLAQLLSWLGLALSVWWVFELGKREMPLPAALLAAGLTASHTAVMLLSSTAYVESFAMLWITAAVACFCRWREIGSDDPRCRGWLMLAAVFSGLAAGTKYTGGLCPAILFGMLAALWAGALAEGRGGRAASAPAALAGVPGLENLDLRPAGPPGSRERLRDLLLFACLASAVCGPWLVKNAVVSGNPVFPFLARSLPSRVEGGAATAERYFGFLTEYQRPVRHFARDLVQFPYLAARGSLKFGGGADVLGDFGWGLLFAALPAALLATRRNRTLRRLLLYCGLHWAAWFLSGTVLRFLVPIVPLAALPAAAGLHEAWLSLGAAGRGALAAGGGALLALNLGLFGHVHGLFDTWDVLLGHASREQYLSRRLDYYPCAAYARDNADKNGRILVVGEQRGYHIAQDHVTTSAMSPNRFVDWANAAGGPEDLARRLRTEGRFTHVLTAPQEAKRLAPYGALAFTESGRRNWEGLEAKVLKRLAAAPGCAFYEVPE